jgi:hypothetical protein
MAVDELDDQRGHHPWHNESTSEVRCGKVGHNVMLEMKGGAKLFGTHGRGMILSGSLTTRGNKIWEGTRMGPRELFKSKSLSHVART